MSELIKWLISVMVVVALGFLFYLFPGILLGAMVLTVIGVWVFILKMMLFEVWRL